MGLWIIRICVAAILGLVVTGIHTQAPLVTLNCPPHKNNQYDYPEPENCASSDILISLTILDLWHGIRENRDDINALSTTAIAVFTFTLWLVTWQMVRIARDQQADTLRAIEAGEKSARAAQKTAIAAQDSSNIARLAFTVLERPYIMPTDIGNIFYSDNFPKIRHFIRFTIGNYGKTPAVVREVGGKFIMIERPITKEKLSGPNMPDGNMTVEGSRHTVTLGAGERAYVEPFRLPEHVQMELYEGFGRPVCPPANELFLSISVAYWDTARLERIYFSTWRYDRFRPGFVSYGGKDYNYEEQRPV